MMGKGPRQRASRSRTISAEEAEIWRHATRALAPVKAKPRVLSSSAGKARAAAPEEKQRGAGKTPQAFPAGKAAPRFQQAPGLPHPLDRRKARRIATGKIRISARLDLHGSYQRDAREQLRAFLIDAHANGCSTVLVITGKGGAEAPSPWHGDFTSPRPRGVLRRNVPLWLTEPDLRGIVGSFAEAGVRHGGAGALYVELRKGPRPGATRRQPR